MCSSKPPKLNTQSAKDAYEFSRKELEKDKAKEGNIFQLIKQVENQNV